MTTGSYGEAKLAEARARLFFSYSHQDKGFLGSLESHLSLLRRQGILSTWSDQAIAAGADWEGEIDENLEAADIVLLLISSDFLGSDFCWSKELRTAMGRHESGLARVVPVIVRPCDWQTAPFGKLQALPTGARPVALWSNEDEAWLSVAEGLRSLIHHLPKKKAKPVWRLRIDASLEDIDPQQLEKITELLKDISGDAQLQIEKVTRGSVDLHLRISSEGVRRLLTSIASGELAEGIGFEILDFSRTEPMAASAAVHGSRIAAPAKLLFVGASPGNLEPLRLDEEVRAITRSIEMGSAAKKLEFHQSLAVRPADLFEAIVRYSPDIVHFSGHGSPGALRLVGHQAGSHEVPISALANLLGSVRKPASLVVLNACFSAHQAEVITQSVPCVVGMSHLVSDDVAIEFAGSFYKSLAFGESVGSSLDLARVAVEIQGLGTAAEPMMVARRGVDPRRMMIED